MAYHLTLKQVFEANVAALVDGSLLAAGGRKGNCCYFRDDKFCAIGCALPMEVLEEIERAGLNGSVLGSLYGAGIVETEPGVVSTLLMELQAAHDSWFQCQLGGQQLYVGALCAVAEAISEKRGGSR